MISHSTPSLEGATGNQMCKFVYTHSVYLVIKTLFNSWNLEVNCLIFLLTCLFLRLEPLKLDNAAYPFLALSGIPSVSFRFTSGSSVSHFCCYSFLSRAFRNVQHLSQLKCLLLVFPFRTTSTLAQCWTPGRN